MSRLSKLLSKPKEVEIEGEKFTMHPLKGKHMHLFMNDKANPTEMENMAKEIIFQSLKPSLEDLEMEEIEEMSVDIFNKLLVAAMDVNGMGEDDRVRKVKEQLVQQRSKGN